MLKLFTDRGPWGPWNAGDTNKEKPKNSQKPKQQDSGQTFEDFIKKIDAFLKNLLGGNGKNQWQKFSDKTPKSVSGLVVLTFILLWLSLGIYKINPDENAAILYFGKFYKIATPGLNYAIPYPFGQVIKKSVTTVNTEEFGFSSVSRRNEKRNFDAESLMLTGDENIVDIEFQVQWQISDITDFVFNIAEPNQTIRQASESAMREIIARTPIVDALSDGKKRIEQETKLLLQQTLDSYKSGVRITLVQLRRVDPPLQVIDAFRDVQTAKADKEKQINQAQSYANDIIPKARGAASKLTEDSQAFASEVVTHAQGESGRFVSVYNQYSKARQVTKKRIYLETMEKIYRDTDKVIIDKGAAKSGVIPYFPLNEMKSKTSEN